jgi:hypothetical protein
MSKRAKLPGTMGFAIVALLAKYFGTVGWAHWITRGSIKHRLRRKGNTSHFRRADDLRLPASVNDHPPIWLRNAHVQSILGASSWRVRRGAQALRAAGATTTEHLLDEGAASVCKDFTARVQERSRVAWWCSCMDGRAAVNRATCA